MYDMEKTDLSNEYTSPATRWYPLNENQHAKNFNY